MPAPPADDPDERLSPPWEDTPDETDAERFPRRRTTPGSGDSDTLTAADMPVLLATLADASDALAGSTRAPRQPTSRSVWACSPASP